MIKNLGYCIIIVYMGNTKAKTFKAFPILKILLV